ncbi:MAG: carbon storage regulator [Candidatus Margulisiibacteriota bacterium]|nr:MAG: carbon storage regulator [Candidatus Margulisbacteria bacterium GWD2_39_127]OGI03920.1 MAG: carbon storage regulator [Candidatus Margulisbacteria bacterium GWF2_38_17]OGI08190.1 MAG: carbon storage regulator [Candidatus Margulisbacteria bacterium GWE2_39_32]PZM78608.1 MAG: carbon storage regulator [Candidatus Margulisiibacteriota bacterium]HAR61947.1 carbon storage regulator [Candidatus Margulisiibacteriota bacterium]
MLVLSRKLDQSIIVNDNIEIKVIEIKDNIVKLGITAPKNIPVFRKEVLEEIREENLKASEFKVDDLNKLFK